MDCLKNLTACLGCTKKHAKCSWKDVTDQELIDNPYTPQPRDETNAAQNGGDNYSPSVGMDDTTQGVRDEELLGEDLSDDGKEENQATSDHATPARLSRTPPQQAMEALLAARIQKANSSLIESLAEHVSPSVIQSTELALQAAQHDSQLLRDLESHLNGEDDPTTSLFPADTMALARDDVQVIPVAAMSNGHDGANGRDDKSGEEDDYSEHMQSNSIAMEAGAE